MNAIFVGREQRAVTKKTDNSKRHRDHDGRVLAVNARCAGFRTFALRRALSRTGINRATSTGRRERARVKRAPPVHPKSRRTRTKAKGY